MRVLAEPEEPFVVIGGEGLFELLVPVAGGGEVTSTWPPKVDRLFGQQFGTTISPKEPDLARRTDRGGYGPDAYRRCATLMV
jgi:hypothetical protein